MPGAINYGSKTWDTSRLIEWNFTEAEKEFKRAIELNPNYATAYQWYSNSLASRGEFEKSMTMIRRAQELDPLSLIISDNVGFQLYCGEKYDEAIRQFHKTLELDPSFFPALRDMGVTYLQMKKYSEAERQFQKAILINRKDARTTLPLFYAYSGEKDQARTLLDELFKNASDTYIAPCYIAQIYSALGERDQAFHWLERALEVRDTNIVNLQVDPLYKNLRSDPRFEDLKNRIGFWR